VANSWCWFVLREEHCWLVPGGWFVVREKYCWLVADKPSEQGAHLCSWRGKKHPSVTAALYTDDTTSSSKTKIKNKIDGR
jgi:hypothetical protein